ncbi:MAG: hypothetical protein R2911_11845 [Caldilineaceae bacterium]
MPTSCSSAAGGQIRIAVAGTLQRVVYVQAVALGVDGHALEERESSRRQHRLDLGNFIWLHAAASPVAN